MHSVNLHGNIITNRKGFSGKPPAVSSHIESSRLGVVCLHFDFLRGVLNICPPKYIIRPYASIQNFPGSECSSSAASGLMYTGAARGRTRDSGRIWCHRRSAVR